MRFIIERKQAAATVVTASTRWAPSTAAGLADFLGPELKDSETMPDLELLQKLFGRALARRWNRLEATDKAEVSAAARYRRSLAERGGVLEKLYRGVVDLRMLICGVFGATQARRLLGLRGRTSPDPVVLLRQAKHTVDRLLDTPMPRAAFEPSDLDRARWAAPMDALARTLAAAHARASVAAKQLDAAAAERRRAITDFNAAFAKVGVWLAGTYRAAGRDLRAEAVRPSGRRPGLLLKDDRRTPAAEKSGGRKSVSALRQVAVEQESPPTDRQRREPPMSTGVKANRLSRSA